MANFTVGRVGMDVAIDSVPQWDESGARVSVSFLTPMGTAAAGAALAQQLSGYIDSPDEDFVPVTWADRSFVNGFYRVLDVSVEANPDITSRGAYQVSLELEKVQGFAAPQLESILLGAMRVNAHGIVTGTSIAWHGVPTQILGYDPGAFVPDTTGRSGEDGTCLVYSGSSNAFYAATPAFFVSPSNRYKSAATLKVGGYVATGRQVANSPTDWVLSNGLVRLIMPDTNGLGPSRVTVQVWSAGAWVQAGVFTPALFTGAVLGAFSGAPHTLTVLRNSPEEVAIRLTYDTQYTNGVYPVTMDLGLRRGAYVATGRISTRGIEKWGIRYVASASQTALTGGRLIQSALFTAEWLLAATPDAFTVISGATAGIYLTTAGTRFDFGIGGTPDITLTLYNTPQSIVYQYMAAQNEKLRVVAR